MLISKGGEELRRGRSAQFDRLARRSVDRPVFGDEGVQPFENPAAGIPGREIERLYGAGYRVHVGNGEAAVDIPAVPVPEIVVADVTFAESIRLVLRDELA